MENEGKKEQPQKGHGNFWLEDSESSKGIRLMLGTLAVGFGVMGSIGAWWRFADLFLPLRILIAVGALFLVFLGAWIFFAFAAFHVWPFSLKRRRT